MNIQEIKESVFEEVELALSTTNTLDHNKEVIKLLCINYTPKQAFEAVKDSRFDVCRRMLTKHKEMITGFRVKVTKDYFNAGLKQDDPLNGVFLDAATRKDMIVKECTVESVGERLEQVKPKVIDVLFAALESGEEKPTTVISIYNQLLKMTGQEVELDSIPEEETPSTFQPDHDPLGLFK